MITGFLNHQLSQQYYTTYSRKRTNVFAFLFPFQVSAGLQVQGEMGISGGVVLLLGNLGFERKGGTWRMGSQWRVQFNWPMMIVFVPKTGVVGPLPNGLFTAYKWGDLLAGMILQISTGLFLPVKIALVGGLFFTLIISTIHWHIQNMFPFEET